MNRHEMMQQTTNALTGHTAGVATGTSAAITGWLAYVDILTGVFGLVAAILGCVLTTLFIIKELKERNRRKDDK